MAQNKGYKPSFPCETPRKAVEAMSEDEIEAEYCRLQAEIPAYKTVGFLFSAQVFASLAFNMHEDDKTRCEKLLDAKRRAIKVARKHGY